MSKALRTRSVAGRCVQNEQVVPVAGTGCCHVLWWSPSEWEDI